MSPMSRPIEKRQQGWYRGKDCFIVPEAQTRFGDVFRYQSACGCLVTRGQVLHTPRVPPAQIFLKSLRDFRAENLQGMFS